MSPYRGFKRDSTAAKRALSRSRSRRYRSVRAAQAASEKLRALCEL